MNRDDLDTDPDGPSASGSHRRLRAEALTDEGAAVAESSRGAWRLVLFIAAILTGAGVLMAGLVTLVNSRAETVAESIVAPVKSRIEEHLADMKGERRVMDLYVKQQSEAIDRINRKLDALCRASAKPQVCIGGSGD